jgi:hypothetical protein
LVGQLPADPQVFPKRRLSLREFPLGLEHVTDPVVGDRQLPLGARPSSGAGSRPSGRDLVWWLRRFVRSLEVGGVP